MALTWQRMMSRDFFVSTIDAAVAYLFSWTASQVCHFARRVGSLLWCLFIPRVQDGERAAAIPPFPPIRNRRARRWLTHPLGVREAQKNSKLGRGTRTGVYALEIDNNIAAIVGSLSAISCRVRILHTSPCVSQVCVRFMTSRLKSLCEFSVEHPGLTCHLVARHLSLFVCLPEADIGQAKAGGIPAHLQLQLR